jgi:peptide deformylase
MVEIVTEGHPVLREVAKEVASEEIGGSDLTQIISNMKEALNSIPEGVAIAAPQIAISKRITVISKRVGDILDKAEGSPFHDDLVLINPVITKLSKEKEMMDEGCLSIPHTFGKVERSTKASIEALNEKGERIALGGGGLVAQIFQHEVDHLNGILFIDKAVDVLYKEPEENDDEN